MASTPRAPRRDDDEGGTGRRASGDGAADDDGGGDGIITLDLAKNRIDAVGASRLGDAIEASTIRSCTMGFNATIRTSRAPFT